VRRIRKKNLVFKTQINIQTTMLKKQNAETINCPSVRKETTYAAKVIITSS